MNELEILILFLVSNKIFWTLIPIIFVGIITDRYQEEFKISWGSVISNGALVVFSGFSWLQILTFQYSDHDNFTKLFLYSLIVILYGMLIMGFGIERKKFIKHLSRIRIITYILIVSTIMMYDPNKFNLFYLLGVLFIFPFYYLFINRFIHCSLLPDSCKNKDCNKLKYKRELITSIKSNLINLYLKK